MSDISDLQQLVDSMNLSSPSSATADNSHQIDMIADAIRERLGIDLGRNQFHKLAQSLLQMTLERRREAGEGSSNNNNNLNTSGSPSLSPSRSVDPLSNSDSPGSENLQAYRSHRGRQEASTNRTTAVYNNNNHHQRGRSPGVANRAKPPPTNHHHHHASREKTPLRTYTQAPPPSGARQPPLQKHTRSLSPAFNLFRLQQGQQPEDEKKETDTTNIPAQPFTRPASRIDTSADQPIQPSRPPSPALTKINLLSSPPRGSPSRPNSPFGRPGLQEDSDPYVPMSPSRPAPQDSPYASRSHQHLSQHSAARARSVTPRQTRPPTVDDDDDDDARPLQSPGHRKAKSDQLQNASDCFSAIVSSPPHPPSSSTTPVVDTSIPFLNVPELSGDSQERKPAAASHPASMAAAATAEESSMFTPPPRSLPHHYPSTGSSTSSVEEVHWKKGRSTRTPAVFAMNLLSPDPTSTAAAAAVAAANNNNNINNTATFGQASSLQPKIFATASSPEKGTIFSNGSIQTTASFPVGAATTTTTAPLFNLGMPPPSPAEGKQRRPTVKRGSVRRPTVSGLSTEPNATTTSAAPAPSFVRTGSGRQRQASEPSGLFSSPPPSTPWPERAGSPMDFEPLESKTPTESGSFGATAPTRPMADTSTGTSLFSLGVGTRSTAANRRHFPHQRTGPRVVAELRTASSFQEGMASSHNNVNGGMSSAIYHSNFGSLTGAAEAPAAYTSVTASLAATAEQNAAEARRKELEAEHARRMELISAMRDEARAFYGAGDFRASIRVYTKALANFTGLPTISANNDVKAVLMSNRAACLMNIGAFQAAKTDCEEALPLVSEAQPNQPFSNDSGPLLKVKLFTRLGRAMLKLGEHKEATEIFDISLKEALAAEQLTKQIHSQRQADANIFALRQMKGDANAGKMDAHKLRELLEKIATCTIACLKHPTDRRHYTEALGYVSHALAIAGGSSDLYEKKLTLLASLKRWREAAGFCERLAASNVAMDNVFIDELASKSPFPGVPPAAFLTATFFADSREDSVEDADLKLPTRSAAEAVLRLPYSLTPYYLRALRLEERYPAADSALRALEELVERGNASFNSKQLKETFNWLGRERSKLTRTRHGREKGDDLFRTHDYDLAASQYAACLTIDAEGIWDNIDGDNAGGRLHAVLHCNRAACLMAVKRFPEAIEECTAALRIHSKYMKAILRRSRCYMRLCRYPEAVAEYQRWLNLVEEARTSPNSSSLFNTPCLFDGPKEVPDSDIAQVKRELDEVHKAKRRAEAKARETSQRREWDSSSYSHPNQSSWRQSRPAGQRRDQYAKTNWQSSRSTTDNAETRRDNWYSQTNDSRRWDSFAGSHPRGHHRSKSWGDKGKGDAKSTGDSSHSNRTGSGFSSNTRGGYHDSTVRSPGSDLTVDHYTVLGVSQNASDEDIKKSYRRLALKYHPDKNKDDGAADKFRRIKLAYETLSEPVARRQYDTELRYTTRF